MTAKEVPRQRASMPVLGRSARHPEHREAFFDLAATRVSAAAIEDHAARTEKSTAGEPSLRRAAAG